MESQFRRKRNRPMAEMNVVPYIDVMLVLLTIFMVTAPMLTQGVEVDLPAAATDTMTLKEKDPIVVSVRRDGSLWLRSGEETDRKVAAADLSGKVREALADRTDVPVLVNGDRHVDYGEVVKLMASLQQAGISNVGLLTDPDESR